MAAPVHRHRVLHELRAKLPELMVEAASVLLAVLLALAVDEWRQDRADRALARHAEQGIHEEIRLNREQLRDVHANHLAIQRYFVAQRAAAQEEENPGSLSVDFSLALLSDAAWETARVTQAVHFMPYDKVTELARLYQLQRLYEEAQSGFVNRLSSMGELHTRSPRHFIDALRGRLKTVLDLQRGLFESYDEMLGEQAAGEERDETAETAEPSPP